MHVFPVGSWKFITNIALPLQFVSEKSIPDAPDIKNEYHSCLKRAQNLLGNKLDE